MTGGEGVMVAAIRARATGRDLSGLHDALRHDLRAQQIRAEALERRRSRYGGDRQHAHRRAGLYVEVAAEVARAEDVRTEMALRARTGRLIPAVSRRGSRSASLLRPTEGRGQRPGQHACRNYETHCETL